MSAWKDLLADYLRNKVVDAHGRHLERWLNRDDEFVTAHTQLVVTTLSKFIEIQSARILDFGCGSGIDSINLAKRGIDVVGIDTQSALVEIARLRAKEEGVAVRFSSTGDGSVHTQSQSSFDAVISVDVVEHVEDLMSVLAEIRWFLRDGGVAFFSTANRFALANIFSDPHWKLFGVTLMPRSLANWYVTKLRKVIKEYDVTELVDLHRLLDVLGESGFEILWNNRQDVTEKLRHPENVRTPTKRFLARMFYKFLAPFPGVESFAVFIYAIVFVKTWIVIARKTL